MRLQPFHAQPGGGVTAGPKGKPGIQFEYHGIGLGRLMPAGYDPDMTANMDGFKLGLGQSYPVLFRDRAQ